MELHELPKIKGKNKKAKRVGRGYGSGRGGHTTGRGTKGQKARNSVRPGFEGGQNPIYKALPKASGFNPIDKNEVVVVNVRDLNRKFDSGMLVDKEALLKEGLISRNDKFVKVLGQGDISKKITVVGLRVSSSAKEKIIKAGGEVK
jgi:large subunit ribosomal protein L15